MARKVVLVMSSRCLKGFALKVALFVILTILGDRVAYAQTSFFLGVSYFGAIGDTTNWPTGLGRYVKADLDFLASLGYKGVRVWATWDMPNPTTPSLIFSDGSVNANAMGRFQNMTSYAKTKGIGIDLTFSYGVFTGSIGGDFNKYVTGIANVTNALKNNPAYSEVGFDVCNECMGTGLTFTQMRQLIDTVRSLDPGRKVFISFAGGTSITTATVAAGYYNNLSRELNYVAPHFFRDCSYAWSINTGSRLNTFHTSLNPGYQSIPIYLQEENRRDYTGDGCDDGDSHPPFTFGPIGNGYEVSFNDLDTSSFQAKNNGSHSARLWIFHNEAGFNVSSNTMCRQFDSVEFNALYDLACNRLNICPPLPHNPCPQP